jgi:hypothetical protein
MNYELKDKIKITKEFLSELESKGWQEIEHLQAQIANIEPTEESIKVVQLLKNLLTSYYIFTGGLENLKDEGKVIKVTDFADKVCPDKELITANAKKEPLPAESKFDKPDDLFDEPAETEIINNEPFEPFEYFVDFDEPTGEPLTDDDIYNH